MHVVRTLAGLVWFCLGEDNEGGKGLPQWLALVSCGFHVASHGLLANGLPWSWVHAQVNSLFSSQGPGGVVTPGPWAGHGGLRV